MKIRISPAGSKGFTLIELLVVLSLIGVFFSIGLINVGTLYERFIIKENTLTVIRAINKARAFAMSERIPVVLRINTETNTISIYSRKAGEINKISISEGLILEGDEVEFSPLGDNTVGSLKITDKKGRSYIVVIDRSTSNVQIKESQ